MFFFCVLFKNVDVLPLEREDVCIDVCDRIFTVKSQMQKREAKLM